MGKVYLHTVVDTYGSYAFGILHTSKVPESAVAVLHHDALPFCQERGLPVEQVLTDNGCECCGTERPHLGYRNMGKRPIDTVNAYLSVTKEAS